jgi:hypothetical protein
MMVTLKNELAKEERFGTHASLGSDDSSTPSESSLQKIKNLKKQFESLSRQPGIGILERSTLNDLSLMLGTVSEKSSFDKKSCQSIRAELKASFDPTTDDTVLRPELKETLDVISILCKDAPAEA